MIRLFQITGLALYADQKGTCTGITSFMAQQTGICQKNMAVGAISARDIITCQTLECISIGKLISD